MLAQDFENVFQLLELLADPYKYLPSRIFELRAII